MTIFDLFSKRQKRARGEMPDVFEYDNIPAPLRVQIVHIISEAFGKDRYGSSEADEAYSFIKKTLCKEYGLFELVKFQSSARDEVLNYLLKVEGAERVLDIVELCFRIIDKHIRENRTYWSGTTRESEPDQAISELNERFKEHGIGYQFESGEIIRVDSQLLHSETVKPALGLLRGAQFKGANEEFLSAFEHYRHGRHKESLVDALKAFESTLKSICTLKKWTYQQTDTAKALINTCLSNGLLPPFQEAQLNAVRSVLESGVPTVRNKLGGHGQGAEPTEVPQFMVRYTLHLTATTIVMLVEASKSGR